MYAQARRFFKAKQKGFSPLPSSEHQPKSPVKPAAFLNININSFILVFKGEFRHSYSPAIWPAPRVISDAHSPMVKQVLVNKISKGKIRTGTICSHGD